MDKGFITLDRKIMEHPLWQNSNTASLFINLLFLANWKDSRFLYNGEEITIKRGQLIAGRHKLSRTTGIPEGTLYDNIKTLTKLGVIQTKSNNRFTLITIVKYSEYQLTPGYANNKATTKQQPANNKATQSNELNTINTNNKLATNVARAKGLAKRDPDVQLLWNYGIAKGFEERLQLKNRWAIKRLLLKMTTDQIKSLVDLSIAVRPSRYAPAINSYIDLDYKLLKLKSFVEREGSKQSRMA